MKKSRLFYLIASCLATCVVSVGSVSAATKEERVEQWGSQNIAVRANLAAKSMQEGKYNVAISGYRALIGFDRDNEDFYLGLYLASVKAENWNQGLMALEELFDRHPELKAKYATKFAEALRNAGREESEAKAAEKLAKGHPQDENIIDNKVKELIDRSLYDDNYVEPKKAEPVKRVELDASKVHADSSRLSLNYETAFKSENIVVAVYEGYEKGRPISYFMPPKAHFKIIEHLQGAPFNRDLPVKYEFHDKIVGEQKPADWKFDEATMMPKKGSKWILFIPNAVPIDGMVETYHGRYGRQEYTEDNYDKILKIIEEHRGQGK